MRAQVLEQSESKKEAGYLIAMGSNAMRVINKIGIFLSHSLTPIFELCVMRAWGGGYYWGIVVLIVM